MLYFARAGRTLLGVCAGKLLGDINGIQRLLALAGNLAAISQAAAPELATIVPGVPQWQLSRTLHL